MNTKDLPISSIVPGCLAVVTHSFHNLQGQVYTVKEFRGKAKTVSDGVEDYWAVSNNYIANKYPNKVFLIREKHLLRIDGPIAIVTMTDIDDDLPSRMV